jgi:hypothetical protein
LIVVVAILEALVIAVEVVVMVVMFEMVESFC